MDLQRMFHAIRERINIMDGSAQANSSVDESDTMTTAAAKNRKPQRGTETQTGSNSLVDELENAKAELATVNRFLEKVQTFSDVVGDAKTKLRDLKAEEREVAEQLAELREDIKSLKQSIDIASDGMLALLEPGPLKFMPLFDQMEKASPTKHGTNAAKWRERPVSDLRLSPLATSLLYESDVLFIGQLQDRVLDDSADWWQQIPGLTAPIAAAIADKLSDFARKGGDV